MRDEHWLETWKEYMAYLRRNKRRPSKYHIEDRTLVNWLKYNRKIRNKGLLSEERSEKLDVLMKEAEKFRRVNQHQYLHKENFEPDNLNNTIEADHE